MLIARERAGFAGVVVVVCLLAAPSVADAEGEPTADGFPNWAERTLLEYANRARVDPQTELSDCLFCPDRGCYGPREPLRYGEPQNRAARFHSAEMTMQGYFDHYSTCAVRSDIASVFPASCDGSASCACSGPGATDPFTRVAYFGGSAHAEVIVESSDPKMGMWAWTHESTQDSSCVSTEANGHRFQILTDMGAVGWGTVETGSYSTGDFAGSGGSAYKIASGSHYPGRYSYSSTTAFANWYDTAAPNLAAVNVDGACISLSLDRGTAVNGTYSGTVNNVDSGCHRYYFVFHDSSDVEYTLPSTGSYGMGHDDTCADWDSSRPPMGNNCGGSSQGAGGDPSSGAGGASGAGGDPSSGSGGAGGAAGDPGAGGGETAGAGGDTGSAGGSGVGGDVSGGSAGSAGAGGSAGANGSAGAGGGQGASGSGGAGGSAGANGSAGAGGGQGAAGGGSVGSGSAGGGQAGAGGRSGGSPVASTDAGTDAPHGAITADAASEAHDGASDARTTSSDGGHDALAASNVSSTGSTGEQPGSADGASPDGSDESSGCGCRAVGRDSKEMRGAAWLVIAGWLVLKRSRSERRGVRPTRYM